MFDSYNVNNTINCGDFLLRYQNEPFPWPTVQKKKL